MLMVQSGSRSVLADHHAQRLYREAGFLLVFGSRPAIKQELLNRLVSGSDPAQGSSTPVRIDPQPDDPAGKSSDL